MYQIISDVSSLKPSCKTNLLFNLYKYTHKLHHFYVKCIHFKMSFDKWICLHNLPQSRCNICISRKSSLALFLVNPIPPLSAFCHYRFVFSCQQFHVNETVEQALLYLVLSPGTMHLRFVCIVVLVTLKC